MITLEKIQKLETLYNEIDALDRLVSEAIILAKKNKDNQLTMAREGKPITITEGRLWDEVRVLGDECDAAKVLAPMYPAVFTKAEEQRKKASELDVFCQVELGVDYKRLRLIDFMHIVGAMIDYKLNNK